MRVATFSKRLAQLPHLREFLGADEIIHAPTASQAPSIDLIVGWGCQPNTRRAIGFARRHSLRYSALEDGFLRSMKPGRSGEPSLSLVSDPIGMYYDASRPSYLEELLNSDDQLFSEELIEQAREAIDFIIRHRISKYNGAPDFSSEQLDPNRRHVLIVDQVADDNALTFGHAETRLETLIEAAARENPDAQLILKLHPETIQGFRKGLSARLRSHDLHLIRDDCNPISLLESMDKVYVATSQLGFEALLLGKEVVCFGIPFYAGWGLTDDRLPCPRRTAQRTVEQVFAAAYILYTRYVNPATGKPCQIMDALRRLALQARMENLNRANVFCFGVRHWTRVNVKPFMQSSSNRIHFVKTVSEARKAGIRKGDQVVIWGTRKPQGLDELLHITQQPPLSMEDGFLRSVGLGSDFVRPSSLVLDPHGIYFDPSKPSLLENLLTATRFSPELIRQAQRIRKKIIHLRLSKYNSEPQKTLETPLPIDNRTILVPGQVEDDASVRLGCEAPVNTNLALLRAVRDANPDAYIFYKPHPDVESGNRKGKVAFADALQYCDQVVTHISVTDCLDGVDEVHTMTSLVGFEALMRDLPVTVWGRPFYAGWGLTTDKLEIPRRNRQLSVDELVAGALLLYPRYYDWESGTFTDCETIIDKLSAQRDQANRSGSAMRIGYIERRMRKLGKIVRGLANAR